MNRRYFLLGAGTLALNQLTTSCGNSAKETFRVRVLKSSIPAQLLSEFSKELEQAVTLDFSPESQIKNLYTNLQTWQQPTKTNNKWINVPFITPQTPIIPDLVTLGDYWLAAAIKEKLIQPLDTKKLPNWAKLPTRWQELVTRNLLGEQDKGGKVWAAPYRWGNTVIAYRRDKFKSSGWKLPTDWSDLWDENLKGKISLVDQPREVIGLTLKKLGHSYNTADLDKIPELKNELQKLHEQVKFYSSSSYLQPLVLGDTYVAVGWSTDVLRMIRREPEIGVIIPKSGTALWADLWVRPANQSSSNQLLAEKWIDFCWQPKTMMQISLFTQAASPLLTDAKNLDSNPVLMPDEQIFKNSEFLYPLAESTVKQYRSLWQEMRNG